MQALSQSAGEQPTDKIHPILVELQALRQVHQYTPVFIIASMHGFTAHLTCHVPWRMQIPPLLQEGKDPAWRNLQQDLQLMHQKDSSALLAPKHAQCHYRLC